MNPTEIFKYTMSIPTEVADFLAELNNLWLVDPLWLDYEILCDGVHYIVIKHKRENQKKNPCLFTGCACGK